MKSSKPLPCLLLSIIVFSILISGCSMQAHAQKEITFIEESIKMLRKKDNSGEIPIQLKQYYNWYSQEMATCENSSYYPDFTESITQLAIEDGIFFTVTFTTVKDGAVVKYETLFERVNKRHTTEANNPTNKCTTKLPLGYYYVWCERDGKPTSDMEKKIYVYNDDTILLLENGQ